MFECAQEYYIGASSFYNLAAAYELRASFCTKPTTASVANARRLLGTHKTLIKPPRTADASFDAAGSTEQSRSDVLYFALLVTAGRSLTSHRLRVFLRQRSRFELGKYVDGCNECLMALLSPAALNPFPRGHSGDKGLWSLVFCAHEQATCSEGDDSNRPSYLAVSSACKGY